MFFTLSKALLVQALVSSFVGAVALPPMNRQLPPASRQTTTRCGGGHEKKHFVESTTRGGGGHEDEFFVESTTRGGDGHEDEDFV
jgi:hypothetical protein